MPAIDHDYFTNGPKTKQRPFRKCRCGHWKGTHFAALDALLQRLHVDKCHAVDKHGKECLCIEFKEKLRLRNRLRKGRNT